MPQKNWLKSLLVRLSGNRLAQAMLERGVISAQDLMGIGSGASPAWSGEKVLGALLRQRYSRKPAPLCIFDVGSNQGQFLLDLIEPLQTSGVKLTVHAFEPGRSAFGVLKDRFGELQGVRLNNFGLGSQNADVDLFADAQGSGLASLSRRRLDHFGINFNVSERISIRMLDDYCRQQEVEHIDLLKVDVEGHELEVFEGAGRMFHERRIAMTSFEFGGADIDSRTFFQDFWYFFRENGGGLLHRITPGGGLVPIPEYREGLEQFRTTNFLVILPEG